MPAIKLKRSEILTIPQHRVLKALAAGGCLTLGKLGARVGLTGSADRGVCQELASMGLVIEDRLDIDGKEEVAYHLTEAGHATAVGKQITALPKLPGADGKIAALIPNYGSNRLLAPEVGKALAGLSWVGVPFAGGMSELACIEARTLTANDLHGAVINLARVAGDGALGPQLWRRLKRVPFHALALADAQAFCLRRAEASWNGKPDLAWACNYYISSWMGRNGQALTKNELRAPQSVRWDAGGGDSAKRFANAIRGLVEWRRILGRVTFTNLDAFTFLNKCKDEDGHGVYCDPPFPGPGEKYKHAFDENDHRRLARVLAGYVKTRIVCRFYDVPLVRQLYPAGQWEWRAGIGRKASNALAAEVLLIKNYNGKSEASPKSNGILESRPVVSSARAVKFQN